MGGRSGAQSRAVSASRAETLVYFSSEKKHTLILITPSIRPWHVSPHIPPSRLLSIPAEDSATYCERVGRSNTISSYNVADHQYP
jgi:hypothetical protein